MNEKIVMKTVLMICPFARPNIGGVESHLEKLMGYLSKKRCKVVLVTYQPLTTKAKGPKYEKRENVEIYRVTWFGRGWFPKIEPYFPLVFIYLFPGLFLKTLFLYIKRNREIDVIHAHGFIAASISKILLRFFRKPSVLSTHAIYNLKDKRLLAGLVRWLLKGFDTILAVGEPSKKELIGIGLDAERIKTYSNWIDIDIFRPLNREECRMALGLNISDFVVLFLGRLLEIKGVLLLLEVAKKTTKDMKFIFVGDGPLESILCEVAKSNSKIRYYGKLSDEEVKKAYNAADVFVSPVLYEEGFATVYLESLACGTPVITAKRGCLPYFLNSEIADMLDKVDSQNILNVLEYYFESRELLDKKRDLCRKYAEEHFSEKNAEIILNSY